MRKKRLRQDKERNKKYKSLRTKGMGRIEYTDKNGNTIWLNLSKRFLFGGYKNKEYNKELLREARKLSDTLE